MKTRIAWLLLPALLAGCVRAATAPPAEQPALLAPGDTASRAIVQSAVQRALGRAVTLSNEVFTKDSALVIEPVPARIDGQRIDGREVTRRTIERFTLLRVGDRCVLLREGTGERIELPNARCSG
jgi:hypothetical protein